MTGRTLESDIETFPEFFDHQDSLILQPDSKNDNEKFLARDIWTQIMSQSQRPLTQQKNQP